MERLFIRDKLYTSCDQAGGSLLRENDFGSLKDMFDLATAQKEFICRYLSFGDDGDVPLTTNSC
jgi:hypothetical protein